MTILDVLNYEAVGGTMFSGDCKRAIVRHDPNARLWARMAARKAIYALQMPSDRDADCFDVLDSGTPTAWRESRSRR